MIKQSYLKDPHCKVSEDTIFFRYVVSVEEYEAISTYLEITAGIDNNLAKIRLKIARDIHFYVPRFLNDPNLPSDKYLNFSLNSEDSNYFDICCWQFIERRFQQNP